MIDLADMGVSPSDLWPEPSANDRPHCPHCGGFLSYSHERVGERIIGHPGSECVERASYVVCKRCGSQTVTAYLPDRELTAEERARLDANAVPVLGAAEWGHGG